MSLELSWNVLFEVERRLKLSLMKLNLKYEFEGEF